ncbi:hypothetical protein [Intrasporangium sp. DVR]|uniref:hypothetical protein n=1 Tax=Intrasporangium sp. DVR TaxID=3127867 RepID=UPI00313A6CD7
MSELPASVRLALWVTAAWNGAVSPSDALARSFPDLDHVAGDLGRLDVWRDLGERALFVALPRPGDTSRMPRCSVPAAALAAEAGECVFVPSIGGLLIPTVAPFGPEGDTGWRADWFAHDAQPVPRHRLEMIDLRDVERTLLTGLRELTEAFERVGGAPWSGAGRSEAEAALDSHGWGLPDDTPARALRVMALAATAGRLADRAARLTALGSDGLDAGTSVTREVLLRQLSGHSDDALADATNVAVMSLAGWRPA